jgi:hypothetical protein
MLSTYESLVVAAEKNSKKKYGKKFERKKDEPPREFIKRAMELISGGSVNVFEEMPADTQKYFDDTSAIINENAKAEFPLPDGFPVEAVTNGAAAPTPKEDAVAEGNSDATTEKRVGRTTQLPKDHVIKFLTPEKPIYNPNSKDYPLYKMINDGMTVEQAMEAGAKPDAIRYLLTRTKRIELIAP